MTDYRRQPLPTSVVLTYGALGFPLAILVYPLSVWLPRAYATGLGVDLALIGFIIFTAAVFDAITDPVIGIASDKIKSRWGRRKTWIAAGAPLLTLAVWMLLNPSAASGPLYLACWYLFLRVGSTMVLVPYGAWGAELSGDYGERTRLFAARQAFVLIGLIAAALIPAIVERSMADNASALVVLESYSWLVLITLLSIAALLLWRVPEPAQVEVARNVKLLESLQLMWANRLFRRVIIIELLITGGEAFRNSMSLFFIQDAIGIQRPGTLYLIYFSVGLLAIPAWSRIAKGWGKHRSLASAMVLVSVVSMSIFFLDYGDTMAFTVLFAVKGFCFGAFAYLPLAMLADVVDIDTAKTGHARTGSYFAVHGFMTKCAASFAGLSLPLLSWAGYSAAQDAVNGPQPLLWLTVLYAVVPTVLFVFAFWLCWTWPLTAERHAELRSELEQRQVQPPVDNPLSR